jgi:hypothetical protein
MVSTPTDFGEFLGSDSLGLHGRCHPMYLTKRDSEKAYPLTIPPLVVEFDFILL